MTVLFSFAEEKLPIKSISLQIYIAHSTFETVPMVSKNSIWQCELYKFIINDELPLCDPYNNLFDIDQDENLWSLLIIDENEDICINPRLYHVTIANYRLSANEPSSCLGAYQNIADEKISATIICKNVSGIHLLTAAWYTPSGILYEYSESPLCVELLMNKFLQYFGLKRAKL